MTEWQKRAKDTSPEKTIEKIEGILKNYGFKTEYEEMPLDVPGCYSSRVSLVVGKSRRFGTNGKGSTPIFCKASAYAELMERVQNRVMMPPVYSSSAIYKEAFQKYAKQYPLDFESEAEKEGSIINLYIDTIAKTSSLYKLSPENARTGVKLMIEEILGEKVLFGQKIYNYTKNREEIFSLELMSLFIGSNGMAAGNTLEEAIVQATCEIFERMALAAMLRDHVSFPDIPREAAFKDEYIKIVVTEIESRGYTVSMKDASLGKGLPVVGAFIFDKKNQTMSFHMGSHPSMFVALERIFTETMQGVKLKDAARMNTISFSQNDDYQNFNAMKVGLAPVPADSFIKEPDYQYSGWNEIKATDNKAMAKKMLDLLGTFGQDVYVLDVSWMGFPSVLVFSPLVSDARAINTQTLRFAFHSFNLQRYFRRIDTLTEKEVRKMREYVILQRNAVLENEAVFATALPIDNFIKNDFFGQVAAYCTYRLGDIKNAALLLRQTAGCNLDDQFIKAQSTYLTAMNFGKTVEEAKKLLEIISTKEIAEKVVELFSDPEKILEKGLPHCTGDCKNCKNVNCLEEDHSKFYAYLLEKQCENMRGINDLKTALDIE